MSLSGSHVLVQFTVQNGVRLGDRTGASAKVLTPLGQEYLDLEPAGSGQMAAGAVIPQSRTHETQTIVSTIRAGANVVQGINLRQLVQAMAVTNQDLEAVPPGATSSLLKGLSQLSDVIASRSGELAQLVQNVSQLTATLHQHGTQLFSLLGQSDLVLQVLNQRHATIDQLLKSTATLTQQLEALLAAHRAQVGPLLSDLQTVSGVLAKDGNDIEAAIPLLTAANKYLANVTGSGAFGDFVMPAALIPDNIIAQCSKPGAINPVTGCNP
jgi:phospholipid/cholesterol/gamma-HCH transport system substrate-binding protein